MTLPLSSHEEIRKAAQKGRDAAQEIEEADINALHAAKEFTKMHGLLGFLSRYYLAQPVVARGKPFIAPEAVFSKEGQLITIDPAAEGRALLSPGGRLDQLSSTDRVRAAIAATHFTAPVPYDRIALPSEVSFVARRAEHGLPLYDAHAGELVLPYGIAARQQALFSHVRWQGGFPELCRAQAPEKILTPHTSIYITCTSPSAQCSAIVCKPVKGIQLR